MIGEKMFKLMEERRLWIGFLRDRNDIPHELHGMLLDRINVLDKKIDRGRTK